MIAVNHKEPLDERAVLSKALLNAGKALGLRQTDIAEVIGRERTSIARGLNPESKEGQLALLLIRCYRSLYVLVGGEDENIKHWMATENSHTGAVPREQIKTIPGLVHVLEYLDAMRGKV